MIGEGGFGSVYRGVVRVSDDDDDGDNDGDKKDVAIKQLNRNGFQAWPSFVHIYNICIFVLFVYACSGNKKFR